MNPAVDAFLNEVWTEITEIYAKDSKRIGEFKKPSKLQAGVMQYLRIAWRKGKYAWADGNLHIDVYEPFSWSDDSYKVEAGSYITELTDELLTEEFFPALCERVDNLFRSDELGPRFFDYRFEIVFEFEWEKSKLTLNRELLNEPKLTALHKTLEQFIQGKILSDPPVLPAEEDMFFFAQHLVNPDMMKQDEKIVDPLIRRLSDKLRTNPKRKDEWVGHYTRALDYWAQDRFLPQHFYQASEYSTEWIAQENAENPSIATDELNFFIYTALQLGLTDSDTRQKYLELAAQLGSQRAADYLKSGSGKFASIYRGERMEGSNNDVTQTIEIRILSEEELAYGEALDYIIGLLKQGFPKGYKLNLKSRQKHFLPVKKLAKSKLHQFFAVALTYPNLYPKLAEYADTVMEEFAWYADVEPGEKSVIPGTYAVMGLGLFSESYFPLVCRYMDLVDTEHQLVQDYYAEAFIEAHGVKAEHMPVLVSILLGGNEEGRPVKNIIIDRPELAEALHKAVKGKEIQERELVLCRIFGSMKKLVAAAKEADPPLKEGLEKLVRLQMLTFLK